MHIAILTLDAHTGLAKACTDNTSKPWVRARLKGEAEARGVLRYFAPVGEAQKADIATVNV